MSAIIRAIWLRIKGSLRRVDGTFTFHSKEYLYSAYRIQPKVGGPLYRIDIKEAPIGQLTVTDPLIAALTSTYSPEGTTNA